MLGIFDSGVGGLTVLRELLRRKPDADFIYLGDTARTPYGNKSLETIERYAAEDVAYLLSQGADRIIVACNTASLALDGLRQRFPQIPFMDVITPAVRRVADLQARRVAVIGTRTTIAAQAYQSRLKTLAPKMEILTQACPLFVPLVEEGWMRYPETSRIVRRSLHALRQAQPDVLILGCTHYPFLLPQIRSSFTRRTKIIDSPTALFDLLQTAQPEFLNVHSQGRQRVTFTDVSPQTRRLANQWLPKVFELEQVSLPLFALEKA